MDDDAPKTLLITLTGKDRPGVTSSVFATLSGAGVEVVDIEQIVLRRRLVLGVLVTAPRDWKKLRDAVEQTAAALDMHVEIERGIGDNLPRREGRSHVTVLGTPLKASAMAAVAGRIADSGANIDRIERMAPTPRSCARCWAPRLPSRASTSPCSRPTSPAAGCG
jgi:phosphoserine phosphatase